MQARGRIVHVVLVCPGDAEDLARQLEDHLEQVWNPTQVSPVELKVTYWRNADTGVRWEDEAGYQGAFNKVLLTADAVVALFVNQLGTPWTAADGEEFASGTAAEVELARRSGKAVRLFPASSAYNPVDGEAVAEDTAHPGAFRGPSGRERRLQVQLEAWTSVAAPHGTKLTWDEWDNLEDLLRRVGNALSTEIREERIGLPSLQTFCDACAASVEATTGAIGKYSGDLFVPRRKVADGVDAFLASASRALALTGAAGMGKSNQLCYLAMERCRTRPALLIRGDEISGTDGLWTEVRRALSESPLPGATADRLRGCSEEDLPVLLDAWMAKWETELVLYIDGINENRSIDELRESLNKGVRRLVPLGADPLRIRLVMSCRDVDWLHFEVEGDLVKHLYRPPDNNTATQFRLVIEAFSEMEYAEAWAKYRRKFNLSGRPEPDLARLCRDPLMLRFLSEGHENRAVPRGANRESVFRAYVRATFRDDRRRSLERYVLRLARAAYGAKHRTDAAELTERDAEDAAGGEENLGKIVSLGIILGSRRSQDGPRILHFKYDAFYEYALARAFIEAWAWDSSTGQALEQIEALVAESRDHDGPGAEFRYNRFLQGTLLYLMLDLISRAVPADRQAIGDEHATRAVREVLGRAAAGKDPAAAIAGGVLTAAEEQRWKTFFCGLVMANPDVGAGLLSTLEPLCNDDSSAVRWAAGMALGALASAPTIVQAAQELLVRCEASLNWRLRETAAVALRQLYHEFDALVPRLGRLADDINWRVRRQAGNTLSDLCHLRPKAAAALLSTWSCSSDWRHRRAVVQAREGLVSASDLAMTVLRCLAPEALEEREEIRWRCVNVLADLVNSQRDLVVEVLAILDSMARSDSSVWVRRHVAYWLPDLYRVALDADRRELATAIVETCLTDPHLHVRWAAVRALGGFAAVDAPVAERWLQGAIDRPEETDLVVLAAECSRRYLLRATISSTRSSLVGPVLTVREEIERDAPDYALPVRIDELARSLRAPQRPDMINAELCKNDRYTNIQNAIKEALATYSDEQLGDYLQLLQQDEDEGVRWGAAAALGRQGRLNGAALESIMIGFSDDYQYWVRRENLNALWQVLVDRRLSPSDRVLGMLYRGVEDPEPEVRHAALGCLVQVANSDTLPEEAHPRVSECIDRLRSDTDRQVRQLAASVSRPIGA